MIKKLTTLAVLIVIALVAYFIYQDTKPADIPEQIQQTVTDSSPSSLKVVNNYGPALTYNPQQTIDGRLLQSGSTFVVPVR